MADTVNATERAAGDDRPVTPNTRVRELAFLHEIAQLATQARDWDELMRSIVDGTTAALAADRPEEAEVLAGGQLSGSARATAK